MATETKKIQLRRDTAANFTSNNPTLSAGELAFETDTGKFKIGNGSTAWTSLNYAATRADTLAGTGGAALVGINNSATGFTANTVQALVGELNSLAEDLDAWRGEIPGNYLQTWNIIAYDAGGSASATRPTGYAIVVWYNHGNAVPTAATANDIYTLPDGTVSYSAKTANYTITDDDMGTIIEATSGTLTFTLATNATEAITLVSGSWRTVDVVNNSGNNLTIQGATGVTVNGVSAGSATLADGGVCTVAKTATDTWLVLGNVT